jgi:hypothetical protein
VRTTAPCPRANQKYYQLRTFAGRIRRHPRRTAADLVELGLLLFQAKAIAGHGEFGPWLKDSIGWSLRLAQEAMTAARRLPELPLPLERFAVSAVRILTRQAVVSTPVLVEDLCRLAAQPGPPVSFSQAREAVSAITPAAVYPRRVQAESEASEISRRLAELVCDDGVTGIHITPDRDSEDPGVASVTVTVLGASRRSVRRSTLVGALTAIAGEEQLRRCSHPEHEGPNLIPPSMYSRRAFFCKRCDRRRVAEWEAKKRAERRASREAAAELAAAVA